MYPSRFEYVAPESVADAISVLAQHGDDAKVLAGGQSLIPLMKLRFAAPSVLVDVNGIEQLKGLEQANGHLRIGALVRHADCERSQLLKGRYGVLGSAAPQISDPIVRNLGTVCGSIAHADPQGDWGSALLAANARVVAEGPSGTREIPISEFFLGPFTTALQGAEVVTEVRVPDPGPRAGGSYLKLERKVGDFATAAVAVQVELDDAGTIARAGIALTAVGPTNVRAERAEQRLAGAEPREEAFSEAARLAAEDAHPIADNRGDAEYKRNVVRVFVERGLAAATAAAREGSRP
ncbi:MAG TPA: xanthine dehydrogenase family protein subunit M [Gaiellaceae bacterium]|nr:xanthine dehydrogenase family protein subunit M [Gaiellaceae bacterium]